MEGWLERMTLVLGVAMLGGRAKHAIRKRSVGVPPSDPAGMGRRSCGGWNTYGSGGRLRKSCDCMLPLIMFVVLMGRRSIVRWGSLRRRCLTWGGSIGGICKSMCDV